jgi:hypothetical protein
MTKRYYFLSSLFWLNNLKIELQIDNLFSISSSPRAKIKSKLYYWKQKKFITTTEDNKLFLNNKCLTFLQSKFPTWFLYTNPWDEKWTCINFDIPNKLNTARHNFRRKLLHFGFINLQRSVFISPYDFGFEFVEEKIRRYVFIIRATNNPFNSMNQFYQISGLNIQKERFKELLKRKKTTKTNFQQLLKNYVLNKMNHSLYPQKLDPNTNLETKIRTIIHDRYKYFIHKI